MKYCIENSTGFTLVELMVTVAIASIIVGIGIPSFDSAITNSRQTAYANEILTALNLAKSEAVKRGVRVTVRRKGTTVGQWKDGWDIFVDSDGNNTFNDNGSAPLCEINGNGSPAEDCLLRSYDSLPAGYTLTTGGSLYKDYATYDDTGMSTAVIGDTFRLCQGTDTASSKAIIVNSVGRARVSSPAASCP